MDKKLQKFILEIIKNSGGEAKKNHIINKISKGYFKENEQSPKTNTVTQHQLNLLVKESKVTRADQLPDTPYILTLLGYQEFDPWYQKIWRFFTDDLAKILSVIFLVLGIIASLHH